jgi:guanylate kinase
MKKEGKIIVVFGVSGSGQDTVIERLMAKKIKAVRVITTVTREKRPGEKQGQPYYFITREKFEKMLKENKFIEWDEHYGAYYGLPYSELDRVTKTGKIVLLKTEMRGALTIKKKIPSAVTIFIKPPSLKVALGRLEKRKESAEVIKSRTMEIKNYLKAGKSNKFDFVVVNREGKLDETVEKVRKIIEEN